MARFTSLPRFSHFLGRSRGNRHVGLGGSIALDRTLVLAGTCRFDNVQSIGSAKQSPQGVLLPLLTRYTCSLVLPRQCCQKKSKFSQNTKEVRRSPIEGTDNSLNLTVRMDLGHFGGIYSCVPPYCATVAAGDEVSRMTRHAGGCTGRQLSASKGHLEATTAGAVR